MSSTLSIVCLLLIISIVEVECQSQNQCRVPMCDAVFLVDGTAAVGYPNFVKIKDFLRSFVKRFTIGLAASHIGLVQFTPMARPEFYFRHFPDELRIDQALRNVSYEPCQSQVNCYGSDDLNTSLPYAAELALSEAAGNRPEIPDVMIVITTGHQNTKSNTSVLNVFKPLSPRLIYVVEVGDVQQVPKLPGADVIQIFRVDDFDRLAETEESLCISVRGGVAGLVTGGGTGSGIGNANNPNGQGNNGATGTGSSGGTGTGNGTGNGSTGGTGGTGIGGNGQAGGESGTNGGGNGNGGTGGTGGGENGNGGTRGTGESGSAAGTGNGRGEGAANDVGNTGAGGTNGQNGTNSTSHGGVAADQGAGGIYGAGGSTVSTTVATAVAAATFGGTVLGILILLIALALVAFLILAYCLYRKRQENKRLLTKLQELRTAHTNAQRAAASNQRQSMARGVQVVRGTSAGGSTSLSNVRLMNGANGGAATVENGDYYRVNNDRQHLLDEGRKGSGGSEDPNYIPGGERGQAHNGLTRDDFPETGPPNGTYWIPPKDLASATNSRTKMQKGLLRVARNEAMEMDRVQDGRGVVENGGPSNAQGPGGAAGGHQHLSDIVNEQLVGHSVGAREQQLALAAAAGAEVDAILNEEESKRIDAHGGPFRRKRSAEMDLHNRRNSLPSRQSDSNLTGTFQRKQYANGSVHSLEAGDEPRSHSDPTAVTGQFGRKRTHIPVKKLTPAPPPLPPVDLLFMVDNSGSIGNANFDRVKSFLKAVASRIDVSMEGSRMACVMFNQEPLLMFGFDKYLSTPFVLGALDRLTYMGGGTYSGRALRFAADIFKTPTLSPSKKPPRPPFSNVAGLSPRHQQVRGIQSPRLDRQVLQPTKPGSAKRMNVLVFVSDGVTEDHIEEVSENLRTSGVHLAAVSVKGHQQDALLLITRDPKSIFRLDESERVDEWIADRRRAARIAAAQSPPTD